MSDLRPGLDDLVEGLDASDRARLERVHDLLLAAGPPPELSPGLLEAPPEPTGPVVPIVRRYRFSMVAAAALTAIACFGVGYLAGGGGDARPERTIAMSGPGGATGSLDLFAADTAGNRPMELTVAGLPELPRGETYELWLTRDGKLADACGSFLTHGSRTTVRLNVGYPLWDSSGWVVVPAGSEQVVLRARSA